MSYPEARRVRRLLLTLFTTVHFVATVARAADDWPQFRGPTGQGLSTAKNLPAVVSDSENVTWKAVLPGKGWSSPVVQNGRIWLTTATDDGKSLRALAVELASGKLLHDVEVFAPQARRRSMPRTATPRPRRSSTANESTSTSARSARLACRRAPARCCGVTIN